MSTESTGHGEPDRTLRLLWRDRLGEPVGSRGPKQRAERRRGRRRRHRPRRRGGHGARCRCGAVADRLGLKPMSVYTYVPGKAELIDLMVDRVAGEQRAARARRIAAGASRAGRAARVERDTCGIRGCSRSTPAGPPLGPNVSDRWEWSLRAIEGSASSDLDMDQVITLVTGFVAGPARAYVDAERARAARPPRATRSGGSATPRCSSRSWIRRAIPISGRVGTAAGEEYGAAVDPERAFEFGLARVIDGIEAYVAARAAG